MSAIVAAVVAVVGNWVHCRHKQVDGGMLGVGDDKAALLYRLVRYEIRGESLGVGNATTSWKLVLYRYRYI